MLPCRVTRQKMMVKTGKFSVPAGTRRSTTDCYYVWNCSGEIMSRGLGNIIRDNVQGRICSGEFLYGGKYPVHSFN